MDVSHQPSSCSPGISGSCRFPAVCKIHRFPIASFMRILPFVLLCLMVHTTARAQKQLLHFDHISVEEGLSQNEVNCIFQDRKGFLWIGTEDGLNKFDGYQFTKYTHIPGDTTSLSDIRVQTLLEDHTGNLWVGTADGLNELDRETNLFIQYRHETHSIHHNDVRTIIQDRSGAVWIGTKGRGITRISMRELEGRSPTEPINEEIVDFIHDPDDPNSLSNDGVESIQEDDQGNLWIATDDGLSRMDPNTGRFTNYYHDKNNPNSLVNDNVERLYQDREGNLWVGTSYGLSKFNPEDQSFKNYIPVPGDVENLKNLIWAIFEDNNNTFWVGTVDGLAVLERETGTFIFHENEQMREASLSHNVIKTIYQDRSGVLWVGTDGGGLNKLNLRKSQFQHFRHFPNNANSLSYNTTSSFYEKPNGDLWIGTIGGGLNKMTWPDPGNLRRSGAKFEHYRHVPKNPRSLSHKNILSICGQDAGRLWVGTWGGGLNLFDEKSGDFQHYLHDPMDPKSLSDPDNEIWVLYKDRQGHLWVGTDRGLNLLLKEDQPRPNARKSKINVTSFQHDPGNVHSLRHNRIQAVFEDSRSNHKRIWVGTLGGLSLLEWKGSPDQDVQITNYTHDPHNPASLSHNSIITIFEDSTSGILWLGTHGGGLNRFDPATGEFNLFTSKEGLPNDIIYGILQDDLGFFWISTNGGISKFSNTSGGNFQFHNYDVNDGLQSNLFSHNAYLKRRNGDMIFGGVNGFNIFSPNAIQQHLFIPPMAITAFREFDDIVRVDITDSIDLKLSQDENFFSLEFCALDFTNPGKNRYAYKLKGFDKDWHFRNADNRIASYTNLDDGKYVFQVKGSNSDGIWNEEGLAVNIVVLPPLWKRGWFQWMSVFALVFLASVVYGIRLRNIKSQNDYLEMQVRERTTELRHSNTELGKKTQELSDTNVQLQQEVEERRKAEKAAETASKAKSDFLANMSHELRTPLNGILGYAQVLKKDKNLTHKQLASIETIKQSGKHLLLLINDLLDISKIEADKMDLVLSEFQLRDFVNGIVGIFRYKVDQKKLAFMTAFDDALPEAVIGDEKRLRQVLLNLISNAIKFTPPVSPSGEQGMITFRVQRLDGKIRFEVEDNGIGIAKDKLDKIFLPFEQVGEKQYWIEGTGLGLSISQRLVKLMGSELQVQSTLDHGSLFWMDLTFKEIRQTTGEIRIKEDQASEVSDQKPYLIPPRADLESIHKQSKIGDVTGIIQTLDNLEKIDNRYVSFSKKIRKLAENFEVLKIRRAIESLLD